MLFFLCFFVYVKSFGRRYDAIRRERKGGHNEVLGYHEVSWSKYDFLLNSPEHIQQANKQSYDVTRNADKNRYTKGKGRNTEHIQKYVYKK